MYPPWKIGRFYNFNACNSSKLSPSAMFSTAKNIIFQFLVEENFFECNVSFNVPTSFMVTIH
jgi:hypothetical protein